MTEEDKKRLATDPDGLICYEYLANNIDDCSEDIDEIIESLIRADLKGQFSVSAARYLHAIDPEKFSKQIDHLVNAAIELDREHNYLADLLQSLYGENYEERAAELSTSDDNFRRIYKRIYPSAESL